MILERRADQVLLIVEDDGVGFDPADAGTTGHGFGLSGMQERAALVGATLQIESAAGKGTTILVRMAVAPVAQPVGRPCLNAPLRILLADDHVTVRHGLKLLIDGQPDMTVVAEASDGDAAIQSAVALKPDVVVMDISMPGMNGLVATRALKQLQPGIAIVTLTRHADDAYLQELLRAGVSGYVLKQSAPTELLQAIRAAAAGGQYLDSALTARVTAGFLGKPGTRVSRPAATLSEREAEVLRLIAVGLQQQGNRGPPVAQRQDGRGAQGQRHAQARSDRPDRHREIRRRSKAGCTTADSPRRLAPP